MSIYVKTSDGADEVSSSDSGSSGITLSANTAAGTRYPMMYTSTSGTITSAYTPSACSYYESSSTTTSGYSRLILGNSTTSGSSGAKYGMIRLYGSSTSYYDISGNKANTQARVLYLPLSSGCLTCAPTYGTAVGSESSPVYINSSGVATACDYDFSEVYNTLNANILVLSHTLIEEFRFTSAQGSTSYTVNYDMAVEITDHSAYYLFITYGGVSFFYEMTKESTTYYYYTGSVLNLSVDIYIEKGSSGDGYVDVYCKFGQHYATITIGIYY